MKVGVIGAGAWGTALSITSANSGNNVILWAFDPKEASDTQTTRKSPYLDGILIPDNITVTPDIGAIADAEIWLVVTPSAFFRETIQNARGFWHGQAILVCTKGIEVNTNKFMSEVIFQEIPEIKNKGLVGVLSGPQFAQEVAHGVPTGSTLAATNGAFNAGKIALSNLYLEESDDIIGAQICGAGKNVIAVLMGYLTGAGAGENEKALKLTLAWNEIIALGRELGAKPETFLKLCGLGDLFLSATSRTSRNFSAGYAIAKKESFAGTTVEGLAALNALMARAKEYDIRMPILAEFSEIIG